jgi:Family of unknown function (DUF6272)
MPPERELSLFEYYTMMSRKNVIISYKGPVTDVILSEISRDIRAKIGNDPVASRKIFSIFMELAQNILFYSAEKVNFSKAKEGIGILLLSSEEDHYLFSCGNLVENKYLDDLIEGVNMINSMDKDQLREYKRRQRNSPSPERSKGAGFGLTQVAITAGNPLTVHHTKIDEEFSFLSLSIQVNKEIGKNDE